MFGYNPFPPITDEPYVLSLAPYSFLWFQLQTSASAEESATSVMQETPATSPIELLPTEAPALVEVGDISSAGILLVHAMPSNFDALHQAVLNISQLSTGPAQRPHIILTYPVTAGEREWSAKAAELARLAPQLKLAPYSSTAADLPETWPYVAKSYVELARLADEHKADAVIQLEPESDPLPWPCILALADAVLNDRMGLSVAGYQVNRYSGLLNSAALRPLTRAMYRADLRYPLAPDAAYSRSFLQHLASSVPANGAASNGDVLPWPALEAVTQGVGVAQVDVGIRHFSRPSNPDVTALLTQILSSLFADIERNASYWQRSRPLYPVRSMVGFLAAVPTGDATGGGSTQPVDVSSMLASFQLGVRNLQEVWSQAMAPGTLLGIKRLAELPPAQFRMADSLWVRIVWDFLAAYRSRSVNRNHIFGALVPLYLGWAASYIGQVSTLSDAEVEQRIAALALAFEADKAYLMARWRSPDRFTP